MRLVHVTAVALAFATAASTALACATAGRAGDEPVEIMDEEALIIWEASKRTEHFIRRASFKTRSRDFGFLVPTPTKPVLAEAEDAVFDRLHTLTTPPQPPRALTRSVADNAKSASPEEPVRVLERAQVAGYDAVVLEADDAKALAAWLAKNGYETRPALARWLEPYVAAKWKLSAFKLSKPAATPAPAGNGPVAMSAVEVSSKAVRLSFETERPFFPYREPDDTRGQPAAGGRALRVYYVGPAPVKGRIGDGKTAWPGQIEYSQQPDLARELKSSLWDTTVIPEKAWLQRFVDRSSPRPGVDELWFDDEANAVPVAPTESRVTTGGSSTSYGGPLALLGASLAGVLVCVFLVVKNRRR